MVLPEGMQFAFGTVRNVRSNSLRQTVYTHRASVHQTAKLVAALLRQTVHTHRASVHQTAKLVAALLRVVEVTAGLAESNGSLPSGL